MLFIYLAMIDDDTQRSKFEYIYHTYYGMMYKVAYELTKDQRLAEDAVHETMVNIIEDIDTIILAISPVASRNLSDFGTTFSLA